MHGDFCDIYVVIFQRSLGWGMLDVFSFNIIKARLKHVCEHRRRS